MGIAIFAALTGMKFIAGKLKNYRMTMITLLALFTLLLPIALLWFRWRVQYDGKLSDTIESRICLVILISYAIVIVVFGSPAVEGIGHNAWHHRSLRRFLAFYLLPGIGFGIILFPEMAARWRNHYLYLARTNSLGSHTIYGWLILVMSAILALGYHS